MKRYLIIVFSLLAFVSVQAQTFNYTGLEIKQEKVKKKNVYEWENFVLANYGLGILLHNNKTKYHSFGLTYGRVKLFGFYVNVLVSTSMHYGHKYTSLWDGRIDGIYPFYTGKSSLNRASFAVGGIVRMLIPLYLYLGAGYGYQSITNELSSGAWVLRKDNGRSIEHSMLWDVGLQGNIKGFTISAGYSVLTDYAYDGVLHEFKVGLGYTFKDRKK